MESTCLVMGCKVAPDEQLPEPWPAPPMPSGVTLPPAEPAPSEATVSKRRA
jgi:hypothetical protein